MVKKRENSRWIKERKDKKGKLLCLIPTCNNLREKYKKSGNYRNYCKEHSADDMRVFTSWNVLREKVLKRDNYTCVKCGFQDRKTYCPNVIADHIIPIALGGDEWDINNIQTLCEKCNKIKTKEDQKKIAELRRTEKVLINGQQQLEVKL